MMSISKKSDKIFIISKIYLQSSLLRIIGMSFDQRVTLNEIESSTFQELNKQLLFYKDFIIA